MSVASSRTSPPDAHQRAGEGDDGAHPPKVAPRSAISPSISDSSARQHAIGSHAGRASFYLVARVQVARRTFLGPVPVNRNTSWVTTAPGGALGDRQIAHVAPEMP